MNKLTNAQELSHNRQKLINKARLSNYNPEDNILSWEEIESIPCITEREAN